MLKKIGSPLALHERIKDGRHRTSVSHVGKFTIGESSNGISRISSLTYSGVVTNGFITVQQQRCNKTSPHSIIQQDKSQTYLNHLDLSEGGCCYPLLPLYHSFHLVLRHAITSAHGGRNSRSTLEMQNHKK